MKSSNVCTTSDNTEECKLEVLNAWFYRCRIHAQLHQRPNAPEFISREDYLAERKIRKNLQIGGLTQ